MNYGRHATAIEHGRSILAAPFARRLPTLSYHNHSFLPQPLAQFQQVCLATARGQNLGLDAIVGFGPIKRAN
jgi:hypothetical protein